MQSGLKLDCPTGCRGALAERVATLKCDEHKHIQECKEKLHVCAIKGVDMQAGQQSEKIAIIVEQQRYRFVGLSGIQSASEPVFLDPTSQAVANLCSKLRF